MKPFFCFCHSNQGLCSTEPIFWEQQTTKNQKRTDTGKDKAQWPLRCINKALKEKEWSGKEEKAKSMAFSQRLSDIHLS